MVKALADRLAEAFAEYLHELVRRSWYETGPKQPNDELLAEKYRGIRPAFGYPACPDHSEKQTLFDLLDARSIGMNLTESGAMTPTAAVAGARFKECASSSPLNTAKWRCVRLPMSATSANASPRFTVDPTAKAGRSHTCQYCVITVPAVVWWRISTPLRNVGSMRYPTMTPSPAASTGWMPVAMSAPVRSQ